jgi:caffeoyl-CoA O-methyltransferase
MSIVNPDIEKYIEEHASEEPAVLKKLSRETYARVLMPRMLSGHVQGRLLSLISKMIQPEHILEVGTFTGYSAICLAEGLKEGGTLHTIDVNEELEDMVARFIEEAGMKSKIRQYIGNALEIIPGMEQKFDLVFLDADKQNYIKYYPIIKEKLNPGGVILADNVLWSGKVTEAEKANKDTRAILEFNAAVKNDPEMESVIVPLRDGLTLIRKIK